MSSSERDNIQSSISRRRLIQGGISAIVLAGATFFWLRPKDEIVLGENSSVNEEKINKIESVEDRNTKIAATFITAISAGDISLAYELSHPEIKARYDLAAFTKDIQEKVQKYQACKGSKLKTLNYRRPQGVEEGDFYVDFQTDPACNGVYRGYSYKISLTSVGLKRANDGNYYPRYLIER